MIRRLLVVVSLSFMCSPLQAGVITGDWMTFGDAKLTIDTAQGLEFLDLTESRGRSFNEVSAELGVNGDFEGFRFATEQEVVNLINNIGWSQVVTAGGFFGQSNGVSNEAQTIISFLGATSFAGSEVSTVGLTSTAISSTFVRVVSVIDELTPFRGLDVVRTDGVTTKENPTASFLVRASSSSTVPEPTSFVVLGALLAPIAMFRRRELNGGH